MEENYLKQELYNLIQTNPRIFDFIQSGSLDGIWYWDLENIENEWMSAKFWQTLGYNPEDKEHLSSEWQDIIFPDDLQIALDNFHKHCGDENHPYDQIVRYKHKNGSTVWIRCRGLAIRDKKGKAIRMLGAHTDITKLKQAEEELRSLSEEYERVFNGTQDAMFLIEIEGKHRFRYIRNNRSHQIKTGITLEELRNKTPQELLGQELGDKVSENYQRCVDSKQVITYEEELTFINNTRIWLTTLTPNLKSDSKSYIVGSSEDITERKRLELELEKSANYDKLTKIPNRRLLFEQLKQTILECKREGSQFALLFIDLDGFKAVNDNYGHEIGDKVLITVANRLLKSVRESDIVARMGGDEFVVILRKINNYDDIQRVVSHILLTLNKEMNLDGHRSTVNCSIGIALYPAHGKDSNTLLRNADIAMYSVKKSGRGGFGFAQ